MRRSIKKDLNLSKLKTGCAPCLNEAKKIEQKILNRDLSKIKIEEIKNLIDSRLKNVH